MASNVVLFSFFAGIGLLDLGFEMAGCRTALVNEVNKPFLLAYRHARVRLKLPEPSSGYSSESAESYLMDERRGELLTSVGQHRRQGSLVGFIGGPPCPDFSAAGRNRGHNGINGRLTEVYVRLVCDVRPDFFVFENVKGLWRTRAHQEFYDRMVRLLKDKGYFLDHRLCNAIEYGVPQDRQRVILWGVQGSLAADFHLPVEPFVGTLSPGAFPWLTNAPFPESAAFQYEWPKRTDFAEDSFVPAPENVPLRLTVQHWFERNQVLEHPNASAQFKPRQGIARFVSVAEGDTRGKSFKRLHRWRFSPTAAYGHNEVHLHPYKPRRLSVAEALAIQSAPADFELPEGMNLSDMFRGVGNGVPFLLSAAIAESILQFLQVRRSETRSIAHATAPVGADPLRERDPLGHGAATCEPSASIAPSAIERLETHRLGSTVRDWHPCGHKSADPSLGQ